MGWLVIRVSDLWTPESIQRATRIVVAERSRRSYLVDMKNLTQCLACGSDELIRNVRVLDKSTQYPDDQELMVEENPLAIVFKNRVKTPSISVVCAHCGFVHLFARSPKVLLQASRRREASH